MARYERYEKTEVRDDAPVDETGRGEEFRESLAQARGRGFTMSTPWASSAAILMMIAGL